MECLESVMCPVYMRHGENLIFLISQPRAGSTMLQRILGGHPEITTTSETWLLLRPLSVFRPQVMWADYNTDIASIARRDFLHSLPHGEADYFEGMRRMYGYLYHQVLMESGGSYFLDKTPRYYLIIPQLHRLFPEARFLFLFRNPLAVLNSILRTWVRKSWFLLHRYRLDLLQAPTLLLKGIEVLGEACVVVNYEKLVRNPEVETRKLCDSLGLDFSPDMIADADESSWVLGDRAGEYHQVAPHTENIDKWIPELEDPQVWRLARDYLLFLGPETVTQMGYSYDHLWEILSVHRSSSLRTLFTWSLKTVVRALNWVAPCQAMENQADLFFDWLGKEESLMATLREIPGKVRELRRDDN